MKIDPKLALALFQVAVQIISAIQRAGWYQQGRDAAYADMSDEQKRRLALAEAARADADIFASGELHDPNELD